MTRTASADYLQSFCCCFCCLVSFILKNTHVVLMSCMFVCLFVLLLLLLFLTGRKTLLLLFIFFSFLFSLASLFSFFLLLKNDCRPCFRLFPKTEQPLLYDFGNNWWFSLLPEAWLLHIVSDEHLFWRPFLANFSPIHDGCLHTKWPYSLSVNGCFVFRTAF